MHFVLPSTTCNRFRNSGRHRRRQCPVRGSVMGSRLSDGDARNRGNLTDDGLPAEVPHSAYDWTGEICHRRQLAINGVVLTELTNSRMGDSEVGPLSRIGPAL